ncbi:MAG: sulfite exporter TauE/SafE family protein [Planctomycetota bacterium]|nr:MAG: sulfite exporter TauE/SafE family protein [Planctomycetota bacterium]
MTTPIAATCSPSPPVRAFVPFLLWLVAFYGVWLTIVIVGNHWVAISEYWPIAVAMAAGSYFAGSTPMGGGTVGFPVLVLLFDQPVSLGRNFGLAIQSIGMVSASIYIFCARRPLDWHLLRPALLGALISTPVSCALIAPWASDLWVKLVFAVTWASFGLMHFVKLRSFVSSHGRADQWPGVDTPVGLLIGIAGGLVSSLTGVGIDMMIYAVLVLIYRADLKVAIPTSVILMAFTSVVGILSNLLLAALNPVRYGISPELFHNWLAAAPVVALGAPFGAIVVARIPRAPTLLIVSTLCIGQFIWTIEQAGVRGWALLFAVLAVLAVNLVFHFMYRFGEARKNNNASTFKGTSSETMTADRANQSPTRR